jgi:hypothetical protein
MDAACGFLGSPNNASSAPTTILRPVQPCLQFDEDAPAGAASSTRVFDVRHAATSTLSWIRFRTPSRGAVEINLRWACTCSSPSRCHVLSSMRTPTLGAASSTRVTDAHHDIDTSMVPIPNAYKRRRRDQPVMDMAGPMSNGRKKASSTYAEGQLSGIGTAPCLPSSRGPLAHERLGACMLIADYPVLSAGYLAKMGAVEHDNPPLISRGGSSGIALCLPSSREPLAHDRLGGRRSQMSHFARALRPDHVEPTPCSVRGGVGETGCSTSHVLPGPLELPGGA